METPPEIDEAMEEYLMEKVPLTEDDKLLAEAQQKVIWQRHNPTCSNPK